MGREGVSLPFLNRYRDPYSEFLVNSTITILTVGIVWFLFICVLPIVVPSKDLADMINCGNNHRRPGCCGSCGCCNRMKIAPRVGELY